MMLDSIAAENMLIKTLGSENCIRQVCDVVELEVTLELEKCMKMTFLSVPLIFLTNLLPVQSVIIRK